MDAIKSFSVVLYICAMAACFKPEMLQAQSPDMKIAGAYVLSGVMETASAFELKDDSTFEFFFSQGALDRQGHGKWSVKEGRVVLNSVDPRPPKDYALVTSKTVPGNSTIIKMVDKNSSILSYSDVTLLSLQGKWTGSTNSAGEVRFPGRHAKTISLLFRLCPERESVFTITPTHNYFEFRVEPWIAEVFFDNFSLARNENGLAGQHPLLEGNEFKYNREP